MVAASCTAELIQDDPAGLSSALNLPIRVIPLELPAYQRKENWGASETFYQMVRHCLMGIDPQAKRTDQSGPTCNILGFMGLGFRHRDDLKAIEELIRAIGMASMCGAWQAGPDDLQRLPLLTSTSCSTPSSQNQPPCTSSGSVVSRSPSPFQLASKLPMPLSGSGSLAALILIRLSFVRVKPSPAVQPGTRLGRCDLSHWQAGLYFRDASHAVAAARVALRRWVLMWWDWHLQPRTAKLAREMAASCI